MKILWLKYCTYMCQPQTYKIAKCLSEFSKTGLNKRIPREGTRTGKYVGWVQDVKIK